LNRTGAAGYRRGTAAASERIVVLILGGAMIGLAACGSDGTATLTADAPPTTGAPRLGAHGLAFHRLGGSVAPIAAPALDTQPSGSMLVVLEGRGDKSLFSLPFDNKGNSPYQQVGSVETYTRYPGSGTAVYAFPSASGGAGHIVTADTTEFDEITLAVVEIANGRTIHDFKWNEVLAPATTTSLRVTTTGPATLVAAWWGDAAEPDDKTARPSDGFNVIESILLSGALVQCAVATRDVAEAGSYDVTWVATPVQGAQMWLLAVQ
jgi:hypothetical protein